MIAKPDLQIIPFASRNGWDAWLDEHHADSDRLWLKVAKKGSGIETVTQPEALGVALCHGWIDSQAKTFDGDYWPQRFTPRKPRSKWSRVRACFQRVIESEYGTRHLDRRAMGAAVPLAAASKAQDRTPQQGPSHHPERHLVDRSHWSALA